MNFSIRSEQQADLTAIRRILLLAFPTDAEANLVDALRQAGKTVVALVAVDEHDAIVGHIAFSPVRIDHHAGRSNYVALAPVAVLPEMQQQGIGASLVQAGLKQCAALGYHGAIVLGDPTFYARFGFQPALPLGLTSALGHDEFLMVWERISGTLPARGGLVHYAEEFSKLTS